MDEAFVNRIGYVVYQNIVDRLENDPAMAAEEDWLGAVESEDIIEAEITDLLKTLYGSISRGTLVRELKRTIAERFDDECLARSIAQEAE